MTTTRKPFKVSTALKDLIGRDLITDDFVAVFELVKNSFDAHARYVRLVFEDDRLVVADDGKGMSRADILNKWLFVAYSAKKDGTEDENYRAKIGRRKGPFAGSKGVGRFSCDRLGERLLLSSRAEHQPVQILAIDWTRYEKNARRLFGGVRLELSEAEDFPPSATPPGGGTGTVLEISKLRSGWQRDKLQRLKRELMKLIDPFAEESSDFEIEIAVPGELAADKADKAYNEDPSRRGPYRLLVNGRVTNPILDALGRRTTAIRVEISADGATLESRLEDRGELIYRIREPNPYPSLKGSGLRADIYFLNQSAKAVFSRRMGLPSVRFGSIFLFRNGFRVVPVGHQHDDFFGLARRQQQGVRRFLGNRDLIGRVDVEGAEGFEESTSRDQGLIRTKAVEELIRFVREKCIVRLERYVVDITWKDVFDKEVSDTSRIRQDESSALVARLVSRLAATSGVELLEYNSEIVRIVDQRSSAFESSLKALEVLAERTRDQQLLRQVGLAKSRMRELRRAEADAREAARRAEEQRRTAEEAAAAAEGRYGEERERNRFLVAAASLDHDTVLNLHHQIIMHASDVQIGVRRMMGRLRRGATVRREEWTDFLEHVSFRNSQILTASRFAAKGGYKQQSAQITADLAVYVRDYVETVASLWAPRGVDVRVEGEALAADRCFRPIEVGILIDNLVSNAAKARASEVRFMLESGPGPRPDLVITVADDGTGWPQSLEPLDRAFEKGVTTTDGSGLGLHHVKQVLETLGGIVESRREPYSAGLDGAHLVMRVPG